jgi:streptomycin 6-kinase
MEGDEGLFIPPELRAASAWWDREGREWLRRLPKLIARYEWQWSIRVGRAFSPGGTASFVAPAMRADGSPAVFKLSLPDPAIRYEAAALRLYGGEGAVQPYEHDPDQLALPLERCQPGTALLTAVVDPHEQMLIGARVLRQLWRPVPASHPFDRLPDVAARMADEVEQTFRVHAPLYDPGLVQEAVDLLRTLPAEDAASVLLHRDFNLGNVLAAQREPWLAIDPQPLVGDAAFDAVQLLLEPGQLLAEADPADVVRRRLTLLASELGVAAERVRAWALARSVEWGMAALTVGSPPWGEEAIQLAHILSRRGR